MRSYSFLSLDSRSSVSGVSFSPALKWSLALLLLLTLGWKWAVISQGDASEPEEQVAVRKVSAFLARNHFSVIGAREVMYGMQLIEATAGLCRMRLALSSSRGWHRDFIRNLSASADGTFVVFGGQIYPEQPMWRTVPDFLWSRLLSGLGFNVHATPVITVMAGRNCEAERLPWNELVQYGSSAIARATFADK
jgi:hypothetical protein